jgi:hypothetical protein
MSSYVFRAIWPVVDPTVPLRHLVAEAAADVPNVALRSRAEITGPGTWSMAPSEAVPGSGRVTDTVLIFEAPAVPMPRRAYHLEAAS